MERLLLKAKEASTDPTRFTGYFNDPVGFCQEILGVTLWDKQKEVLQAAVSRRRIAVRSGHGVGKTFAVACLVIWWLYARKGLVVTTAPTWEHVEGVLWREINGLADRSLVPLPGEPLQTERRITGQWYAIGLSTNQPSAFQGRHHPHLLVVVDEAPGVSEQVHLEISTLATGAENCIVLIGNPTELSGTFYEAFKHPEIWYTIHINCFDHPNVKAGKEIIKGAVTKEWVEEQKAKWGTKHPFWDSRILGEFPQISSRGVIPLAWAERACNDPKRLAYLKEYESSKTEFMPRIGGLDVARYGENRCVLTIRRGDCVESIESWGHTSLMDTTGRAVRAIHDRGLKTLVVDASGIGAGVVDRLLELDEPVQAYNGGHRAFTPGNFANRRSEMWWHLRSRLEHERLLLPDKRDCEQLVADLVVPQYEIKSSGRIAIDTKESLLEQGKKSPDFADSLVLCFALDEDPEAFLVEPKGPNQDPWEPLPTADEQAAPYDTLPMGF